MWLTQFPHWRKEGSPMSLQVTVTTKQREGERKRKRKGPTSKKRREKTNKIKSITTIENIIDTNAQNKAKAIICDGEYNTKITICKVYGFDINCNKSSHENVVLILDK